MSSLLRKFQVLTGNQLKIIALISMTCDHIGLQFFPHLDFLRIIGRLAFPIFAYMIGEGCRYTKNRTRYLLTIVIFAVVYQLVYFLVIGSVYQGIFVSFSLSIILIYLLDYSRNKRKILPWCLFAAILLAIIFVSAVLPYLIPQSGFEIDYGIWGILLPVIVYCCKNKLLQLIFITADLIFLAIGSHWHLWFALAAIPLLALYSGKRGKWKLKYLFYIYYPLHLAAIYGVGMLL